MPLHPDNPIKNKPTQFKLDVTISVEEHDTLFRLAKERGVTPYQYINDFLQQAAKEKLEQLDTTVSKPNTE